MLFRPRVRSCQSRIAIGSMHGMSFIRLLQELVVLWDTVDLTL
jgi:hypothetical protein